MVWYPPRYTLEGTLVSRQFVFMLPKAARSSKKYTTVLAEKRESVPLGFLPIVPAVVQAEETELATHLWIHLYTTAHGLWPNDIWEANCKRKIERSKWGSQYRKQSCNLVLRNHDLLVTEFNPDWECWDLASLFSCSIAANPRNGQYQEKTLIRFSESCVVWPVLGGAVDDRCIHCYRILFCLGSK